MPADGYLIKSWCSWCPWCLGGFVLSYHSMDLSSHRWHFIGIGGAGMSALAAALLDLGARVSGSDLAESDATRDLRARGAAIAIGHRPSNLGDATCVVVTAAAPHDNPELAEAPHL